MPPKHRRPAIPAGNVYPAVAPRPYVFWVWIVLAAVCFAASFYIAKPPLAPIAAYKLEFTALLAAAVLFVWTAFSAVSHRVEVVGTVLRLYGGFFYRNVKADDLDIAAARVVDLTKDREYAPVWWLFGAWLPGYAAGLYLLRREGQAWTFVTEPRSVLWLPRKAGRPYLLSLKDAPGLLARLQKYASRPQPGGEK